MQSKSQLRNCNAVGHSCLSGFSAVIVASARRTPFWVWRKQRIVESACPAAKRQIGSLSVIILLYIGLIGGANDSCASATRKPCSALYSTARPTSRPGKHGGFARWRPPSGEP